MGGKKCGALASPRLSKANLNCRILPGQGERFNIKVLHVPASLARRDPFLPWRTRSIIYSFIPAEMNFTKILIAPRRSFNLRGQVNVLDLGTCDVPTLWLTSATNPQNGNDRGGGIFRFVKLITLKP